MPAESIAELLGGDAAYPMSIVRMPSQTDSRPQPAVGFGVASSKSESSAGETPRLEVSRLAQRGQEALLSGDLAEMMSLVEQGFAFAQTHDLQEDVCFVSLLLVYGDGALAAEEAESAASMYKTAEGVLIKLVGSDGEEHTESTLALLGRVRIGLARADVERGLIERARERYRGGLEILARLGRAVPAVALLEVQNELEALSA